MRKRIIILIALIILVLPSNIVMAENSKYIIIVVDDMSLNRMENLYIKEASIGLLNLKTRSSYSEENLYFSINTGRKLGKKDLDKEIGLEFLGEILKKENPSYLGVGQEKLIISDKEGRVAHEKNEMIYDTSWMLKNTDLILENSNILVIGYEFNNEINRENILKEYIDHYKDNKILILPRDISQEESHILNKSFVPIIYLNNQDPGLVTSLSTKRQGVIALEDISTEIKNTYDYSRKTDIGNKLEIIPNKTPIKSINKIYSTITNLLISTYIFHGMTYITQILLGIWILRSKKDCKWIYFLYVFSATLVCVSLILGIFEFHRNVFLYLFLNIVVSYIIGKKIIKGGKDSVERLVITTYCLVISGVLLYPKMIYNSYIGFNNLIYGARYYGLNNGIVGVLLASSILTFFSIIKKLDNICLKGITGLLIFGLNIMVLSANFGANTGGFITSIVLLMLIMSIVVFSNSHSFKKVILSFIIGVFLFGVNMIFDNSSGGKSHAIEFFYRLNENGFREFIYMASFKAKELLSLTLTLPFFIVLISQGIILKKLREYITADKEIRNKAIIIIVTSLVGFIINDTGIIMLIYMINYLILDLLTYMENQL